MRKLCVLFLLALFARQAAATAVDSIGFGISPLTLYSRASLRDSSFPTTLHLLGATNRLRVEYTGYRNDLPSNERNRQYDNSALVGYYNMEFLLRARRGSVLGRTRLFAAFGGGIFRSRLNETVNSRENNPGLGAIFGFNYFANKTFYVSGGTRYLYSVISYDNSDYKDQNIGGLFFTLSAGIRFNE